MKTINKLTKITLLIFSIFLLSKCENQVSSPDNLDSIINYEALLNISTNHLEFINNGETTELIRNTFSLSDHDLIQLKENLNLKHNDIDYLILYINKKIDLSYNNKLYLKDIQGISTYTKKENIYLHDFFINKNNEWVVLEKFSNKNVDKLQFTLQNLLSNKLENITTLFQIGKISNTLSKSSNQSLIASLYKPSFENSLEKELLDDITFLTYTPENDCFTCPGDSKRSCSHLTLTCKYTCPTNQISEIANYLNEEPVSTEKLYDFRDNFLSKYPKGKEYIDSYYKISMVFDLLNVITLENYTSDRIFLDKVISACNRLQYGEDNEVIVTEEFEQEILKRINSWSTLTSNTEFQNILNKFKIDLVNKTFAKGLKKVKNKTKADILKILKAE